MAQQKVVLVTGASSGIGRAIATLLQQKGYRVFGTKLPSEPLPLHIQFEAIDLDVTDETSIQECVAGVIAKAGRIDVLVNNAGVALVGAVEETSLEEASALFEVNFWGTVQMTQAVLRHMRERGNGNIINMSSLFGIIGTPFGAYYAASKHAIEGFTKSLRYEVKPFGIHVSMIEPGFVKTDLMAHGRTSEKTLADYADFRAKMVKIAEDNLKQGFSPKLVAETVKKIIESPNPKLSYPLFLDPLSRLTSALPEALRERVVQQLMGIYDPAPDIPKAILWGIGAIISLWVVKRWLLPSKRN